MKPLQDSYVNEEGYLSLMNDVYLYGTDTPDRTGVGCRKAFDTKLVWKRFPSSTVRPMGLKYAWKEMQMFLSGNVDTKVLEEQGIMFWKGNTSREFLDSRAMYEYPEGSLGKSYSYQWRNAGGWADQLWDLVIGLKRNPYSRRHAVDLWGVSDQPEMPLLPCWYRWSFFVQKMGNRDKLHLKTHSRSLDILFGAQQHSTQAYMFLMALASLVDMDVGDLSHDLTDVHIYHNQFEYVEELLKRDRGVGGDVILSTPPTSLQELVELPVEAFERVGYYPNRAKFNTPLPKMAV